MSIHDIIGLTTGRDHDEQFQGQFRVNMLADETLEESKQMMLQNMEELLEKNKSYYEGLLGLGYLKEKQAYLKEKGFTVYGAVVTGPVKELLKLKDVPSIRDEQLGDVELWNW
ncbi:anti sigma factor C-terminal domain-containing protein [Lysinibacillus odysseyi]|uniref:anti sigma factor C-terminal domain-containing protein n=1 Tax=Lysinibacillus odysseyi TaxID=202611 RepID=UPI001FD23041|nr:anti sigma factor C-terminal domain-containing protein [Lysinibacillus odysseyi]